MSSPNHNTPPRRFYLRGGVLAHFRAKIILFEATMGFEPMIRVLQTLALPLGHVAVWFMALAQPQREAGKLQRHKKNCWLLIEDCWLTLQSTIFNLQSAISRAGNETRTRDLLLGKEVFYQLNYARTSANCLAESAESQDRTDDTAIFSRVLYQLSYLGLTSLTPQQSDRNFTRM
jgi:hypothetical protein